MATGAVSLAHVEGVLEPHAFVGAAALAVVADSFSDAGTSVVSGAALVTSSAEVAMASVSNAAISSDDLTGADSAD